MSKCRELVTWLFDYLSNRNVTSCPGTEVNIVGFGQNKHFYLLYVEEMVNEVIII